MKKFRLASQILFFAIFLFIFFNTLIDTQNYTLEFEPQKGLIYLFAIDPLIGITTLLTTGTIKSVFILSLIVLLLTFIFGRFFCGFVCPMGTIMHFFSYLAYKIKKAHNLIKDSEKYFTIKFYILFIVIFFAIFKINFSGYLDPISLIFKIFNLFVLPIIWYLYSMEFLPNNISDFLFYNVIGRETIFYKSSYVFGIIFFILIILNFIKSRFWCRFLCPLGALFGLISSLSLFKITKKDHCKGCFRCSKNCMAYANPASSNFKSSECMLLFDCINVCKEENIKYSLNYFPQKVDLNKRNFLKTISISTFGLVTIKISNFNPFKNKEFIRPPGALSENEFLKKCIRCGACIKICPENFLTPVINGDILNLFTPVADPNYGYCLYQCNLCGKICPTGAIKQMPLLEKQKIKIGLAYIDKNRCLPHAYNINCAVCEEHCPTSPKAIYFKKEKLVVKNKTIVLKKPYIDPQNCIGCGICQYKCPINNKPAILVTPIQKV